MSANAQHPATSAAVQVEYDRLVNGEAMRRAHHIESGARYGYNGEFQPTSNLRLLTQARENVARREAFRASPAGCFLAMLDAGAKDGSISADLISRARAAYSRTSSLEAALAVFGAQASVAA